MGEKFKTLSKAFIASYALTSCNTPQENIIVNEKAKTSIDFTVSQIQGIPSLSIELESPNTLVTCNPEYSDENPVCNKPQLGNTYVLTVPQDCEIIATTAQVSKGAGDIHFVQALSPVANTRVSLFCDAKSNNNNNLIIEQYGSIKTIFSKRTSSNIHSVTCKTNITEEYKPEGTITTNKTLVYNCPEQ